MPIIPYVVISARGVNIRGVLSGLVVDVLVLFYSIIDAQREHKARVSAIDNMTENNALFIFIC